MVAESDKAFVYKLIISQLHHDGFNALALLMEQMLLSSKKVQPSDCLTQLLNVCKAVSFADKDLFLEDDEKQVDGASSLSDPVDHAAQLRRLVAQTSLPSFLHSAATEIPSFGAIEVPTDTADTPSSWASELPKNSLFSVHTETKQEVKTETTTPNTMSTTDIARPKPFISNNLTSSLAATNLTSPLLFSPIHFNTQTNTPVLTFSPPDFIPALLSSKSESTAENKSIFNNESLQDVVKVLTRGYLTGGTINGGSLNGGSLNGGSLSSRPPIVPSPPSNSPSGMLSQLRQATNRQHKLKNCPICRKVLVASSLYLHMKIHTGEKNYMCEFCNKRFLLKHHLHSHLKICPNRHDKNIVREGRSDILTDTLTNTDYLPMGITTSSAAY